jgi:hypothetical protein
VADEQFVVEGVVTGGFFDGDAVFGNVGEADAEVVALDAVVAAAFGVWGLGGDARKQAAGGITGDDVGADFGEGGGVKGKVPFRVSSYWALGSRPTM